MISQVAGRGVGVCGKEPFLRGGWDWAGLGVDYPLGLVLPSADAAQLQEEVVRTLVPVILENLTFILRLTLLIKKLTISKLFLLYSYFEKDCSISPCQHHRRSFYIEHILFKSWVGFIIHPATLNQHNHLYTSEVNKLV